MLTCQSQFSFAAQTNIVLLHKTVHGLTLKHLCLTETSIEIQSCRDIMLLNMSRVMRNSAFDQVTRKPSRLSLEISDLDSIAVILSRQQRSLPIH